MIKCLGMILVHGLVLPVADETSVDWSKAEFVQTVWNEAADEEDRRLGRDEYDIIWYENRSYAIWNYDPFEPELEDITEWAAASCGLTYNEFIGRPWDD
jgi:hypothetical protein